MRPCKSSLITKLLILAVMIYAIVTIVALQPKIDALQNEKVDLESEVAQMQQDNLELEEAYHELGTDESTRQLARERLNMVSDCDIVYVDTSK